VLIVSYCRSRLEQTGGGHFSPIGGYHAGKDLALVLDVARFKYPPYWVKLDTLLSAMQVPDPATQRSRGWLSMQKRGAPSAIARFLACPEGIGIKEVLERSRALELSRLKQQRPTTLEAFLRLSEATLRDGGILERVRFRAPQAPEHQRLFEELNALFVQLPLYQLAARHLAAASVVPVALWLLASPESSLSVLPDALREQVRSLVDIGDMPAPLATELAVMRSQVEFLLELAAPIRDGASTSSCRPLPVTPELGDGLLLEG
jgi:glutathione gamma-glutamylcysteinyltransferase